MSNLNLSDLTVRIGVLDYQIRVVDQLRASDDCKLYGEIDFAAGTIRLDAAMRPAFRAVVLWHEIVHGIIEMSGLAQSEETANAIAHGVLQVLRDNPWLAPLTAGDLPAAD